ASCAEADPDAFFPEKGGSTRNARRVCAACPVAPQCLDYALEHDEPFGIWGGMTTSQRRQLLRRGREAAWTGACRSRRRGRGGGGRGPPRAVCGGVPPRRGGPPGPPPRRSPAPAPAEDAGEPAPAPAVVYAVGPLIMSGPDRHFVRVGEDL